MSETHTTHTGPGDIALSLLRTHQQLIEEEAASLAEQLGAFLENQDDPTGLRIDTLRMRVHAQAQAYERIDGLLAILDKPEYPSKHDAILDRRLFSVIHTLTQAGRQEELLGRVYGSIGAMQALLSALSESRRLTASQCAQVREIANLWSSALFPTQKPTA
jgi:hypothetical protein